MDKNGFMVTLAIVIIILIIAVSASYYNYTEHERSMACAQQGLGYEEGGCVEP